jgi:transcription factor IIIB subunit 2
MPVLPEDLIYRFAMKLEFGILTNKVAEDAVRMVQRMSLDWMVMGRRPSGVCGACLILAARMNNFRRTITEVVYVVKVTTHTIQKRLDEFKLTPSSALTVEEFLNNEFLESAHDPPSFYEKSEEFQKKKKSRKRKRKNHDALEENEENSREEEENGDDSNKRQKTATPNPDNAVIAAELRIDADGFAIPPQPTQPTQLTQLDDIPIDPNLIDNAIEDQCGTSFEKLVGLVDEQLDDAPLRAAAAEKPTSEQGGSDEDETSPTASPKRRGPKPDKSIRVPSEWAQAEASMEGEISEIINDPNSIDHAMSYANAAKRAAAHMLLAEKTNPQKVVSMDVHVGEDEFADDPEVKNCLLAPAAVAAREVIWVNENKAWLRKQQLKEYQKRMAEQGPPKARRNRKKKPRIGEGQTSAASSPGEAAVSVLKQRAFSKKINYDAIRGMFEGHSSGAASALGSAGTSRVTSRAGSVLGSRASSVTPSVDASADGGSEAGDRESASVIIRPPKRRRTAAEREESDIESDDDDYVKPTPAPAPKSTPSVQEDEETNDWRGAIKSSHATGGEDEDDYDEEDYGYENGDIDDTGFGMDDEDTGFGDDD